MIITKQFTLATYVFNTKNVTDVLANMVIDIVFGVKATPSVLKLINGEFINVYLIYIVNIK
jgi:hypothetical protein